jgi:hypothetical protein
MANPTEQLKDITAMIAEAREAVFIGKSIDMTQIQGLVKEVCENIQQTPPINEEGIQDKVLSVIKNLNLLVEELEAQKKQAEDNGIGQNKKNSQAET